MALLKKLINSFIERKNDTLSLVHTMLVNMLVVLWMVMQEQLATSVHTSEDYAS